MPRWSEGPGGGPEKMVGGRFSRSLQERRRFAGVRWTAREIFGSRTARPKVKLGAGAPSEICSLCEHVKLSAAPIVTRAARISPCGSSFTLAAIYSRGTYRPTTIDVPMFHFRVRNGTGWGHWAMTTRFQMHLIVLLPIWLSLALGWLLCFFGGLCSFVCAAG